MSNCEDRSPSEGSEGVWVDDSGEVPRPRDVVLTIGNVAKMFKISQLALRYYERRGLIKRRHRAGRSRVYGWADCDRIAFIIKGRRVGLALAEMAILLRAAEVDSPVERIKAGRAKCLELIDRLDRRRQPLRDALAELRHLDTLLAAKLLDGRVD